MVQTQFSPSEVFKDSSRNMIVKIRKNSMRDYFTVSDLCTELDITYSTTGETVQRLEELGLVTSRKKGRTKQVKLTEKGKQVATKLMEIKELTRNEA